MRGKIPSPSLVVTALDGSTMSLGDPNPAPERDPINSGASPKRPQLLVRELDPIAVEIPLENFDRLTDVLHLCGLTPNSDTVEYLWKKLLRNELATVEEILEHQGPLGVSLELDLVTKHEIECRNDLNPEEGGYEDRVSVIISTRHREGSDIGALLNLSEGCPGLEGLFLELQATPFGESPAIAHIYWSAEELADTNAGERWDLLRGFSMHFRDTDLPQLVSLTPGQQDKFHYLSVDLDPMIVRVQRLTENRESQNHPHNSESSLETPPHVTELRLHHPPLHVLERILSITEALQIEGPWVSDQSKREILDHLRGLVYSPHKLDIDALKVCAGAHPCIIFSRENSCDGDVFPPQVNSRVTMIDYTCAGGEFQLEFLSSPEEHGEEVICRWHKGRSRFTDIPWSEVRKLARPYFIESSED